VRKQELDDEMGKSIARLGAIRIAMKARRRQSFPSGSASYRGMSSRLGASRGLTESLHERLANRICKRSWEREPIMLLRHLGGGDGRWVIPRKRLGAEHVIDFIIGERDSAGWGVAGSGTQEPSRPNVQKNGDPEAGLTHAIRQIQD